MAVSTSDKNLDGLTYEEWLAKGELPDGFREWRGAWQHWRRAYPVAWATLCYMSSKTWRRREYERRKKIANAAKASQRKSVAPGA